MKAFLEHGQACINYSHLRSSSHFLLCLLNLCECELHTPLIMSASIGQTQV